MSKATPFDNEGFTLVELMIVLAIVAILAAIAVPAFRAYLVRSSETACLSETRNYVALSIAALANGESLIRAPRQACIESDDASIGLTEVVAEPKSPGQLRAVCSMSTGNCIFAP